MYILVKIGLFISVIWATVSYAQFNGCPPGFCPGLNSGNAPPSLTNLRITDTGDFRVTNTGDNRAVAP